MISLRLVVHLGPYARAAIFVGFFVALLAGLTLAARWFRRHRDVLWQLAGSAWGIVVSSGIVEHARRRYPRAWRIVAARLSPQGYLGLHLTLGLLLSVAALVFFGTVAEDILDREELALVDDRVSVALRAHATQSGLIVFRTVSLAGSPLTIALLGVVVAVALLVGGKRTLLSGWLAALVGGGMLDWVLKAIFRRSRPDTAWQFLVGHSWSFPSGHSMGSLIAYGMLAYLGVLFTRSTKAGVMIVASAALLVLAIGFSRLYLGVHYFTDVVGGFSAGAVWLVACITGVEVARRRRLTEKGEPARQVDT